MSESPTLRLPALLSSVALWCALVAPASADWIVLKDGERIETRGAWKIEGSRLLFTSATGALSSLRVSEVDLEASEEANRPRTPEPEVVSAPPLRRPPALVLDNTNVARARSVPTAESADDPSSEPTPEASLTVASWQETAAGVDGLRFGGVLENPTDNFAVLVSVTATLTDADGRVLDTAEGTMPAASVGPRTTERFEVAFPNSFVYSNVEFEVTYKFLRGAGDDESPATAPNDTAPNDTAPNDPETSESSSQSAGSESESLQPVAG